MLTPNPFIFVRINRKYERIDLLEIVYVESCRGFLKIFTEKKVLLVHATMIGLEQVLPTEQFCRIHRSYLVAIHKIQSFSKESLSLVLDNHFVKLPIGQERYKNALLNKVVSIGENTVQSSIADCEAVKCI